MQTQAYFDDIWGMLKKEDTNVKAESNATEVSEWREYHTVSIRRSFGRRR
jgi:hypothetical protein